MECGWNGTSEGKIKTLGNLVQCHLVYQNLTWTGMALNHILSERLVKKKESEVKFRAILCVCVVIHDIVSIVVRHQP